MTVFMFVNVDWFFLSHRLDIAKESAKRGVDLTVFTDFTSDHSEHAYGDFSILQSPLTRSSYSLISLCVEFFKTFMVIKNNRPDAVHAVTIKPIIFLGIICLMLQVPFIASVSGLGPAFSVNGFVNKLRRRVVMLVYLAIFSPKTTRVICQSTNDANTLLDNNILPKHKVVMTEGSGVAISEYRGHRPNRSHTVNVLMASRLLPDKGVMEFCAAAGAIIREAKFEVRFYLAGPIDSHSPGALSEVQVVEMCDSNDVQFLGNRTDLQDVLAETHIFVLPSYYAEGVPKVLLEAAASGCAVITTDHPGCRDAIIPEETGLLVNPKDISSLTDGLTRLLSNRDLIESMGIAGRRLAVDRFSVTKVVDIHYALYLMVQNEQVDG
jgi:glycosyltransferase involved in cell wall biosynthesis